MPKTQHVSNPLDAHVTVTDYQTGKDASGGELALGQTTELFLAGATITKGQAVAIAGSTGAAVAPNVVPVPTAGPGWRFVGIAKNAASAGEVVEVVTYGFALALVVAGVANNAALTFSGATAGSVDDIAAPDATTIAGAIFGVALAATQTPALTPVWVQHV